MAQYCRYCAHMVCGDANYCEEKGCTKTDGQIKQSNKCKEFLLNPVDALFENKKGYAPRGKKEFGKLDGQIGGLYESISN